ncbi:MAG: cation diffusion facilitator family transporter [Actinomycetota bacterium]|nr:cation diffusion facilitator family transporter [Actinomycetota bacterium]
MRRTEKAALISAASSALLAGGMIGVAVMSGSVSLLAEGIHTITDCVTSVALWIGLRLSERHSKTFPFGLYKLENLIATAIGLLILFSAYELAMEAVRQIGEGATTLEKSGLIIAVMAVTVVVMGANAWYKNKVGKDENSPGLRADARHSLSDLAAALAVMAGVSLQMAGVAYADSIAALVVVLFLVWAGIGVALNGIKVLLDASVEKEILEKVREIAERHPAVGKVLAVEGRNSGSYRFINLSLVPHTLDLGKANRIADEVRDEIRGEIPNMDRVRIDLKVERKSKVICAAPLEEDGTMLSWHFGDARSFALWEIKVSGGEVVWREILANPFLGLSKGKGVRVAEFLAQQGVEILLALESLLGKGAHYALEAQGIMEIVRPDIGSLAEAEDELRGYISENLDKPGSI